MRIIKTAAGKTEVGKMNRNDFIDKLRKELAKLPVEEREAAIEYYEEYFDEAGPEHEQELIEALGNPKRVAAQIKSDYAARLLEDEEPRPMKKGLSAAWWVVLGICSAPVSIPAAIALAALAISIFIAFAGVVISIFAAIAGAFIGSIACVVMGIMAVPVSLSAALFLIGGGLAALALLTAAGIGAVIAVKAIVKAVVKYIRKRGSKNRDRKIIRDADVEKWKYRDPGYEDITEDTGYSFRADCGNESQTGDINMSSTDKMAAQQYEEEVSAAMILHEAEGCAEVPEAKREAE